MHIAALIQVVCGYELIIGDFWLSLTLFQKLVKQMFEKWYDDDVIISQTPSPPCHNMSCFANPPPP